MYQASKSRTTKLFYILGEITELVRFWQPTVGHWDVGDKYATGVTKIKTIRGRENISIGT